MYRLKQIYDELGDNIKTFLRLYDRIQANNFGMEQITANADLDWDTYVATLRPGRKLHIVGAASQK